MFFHCDYLPVCLPDLLSLLFFSTLLSSSLPSVYSIPALLHSSCWVISSSTSFPFPFPIYRNHVWNLILSVRLHQIRCSQGAPVLSIRAPNLHISCQTLTSPTWESSPPFLPIFFFLLSLSCSSHLFFTLPHSLHLLLWGFFSRLFNLFCAIIAPSAKFDSTTIFPPLTPCLPPSPLTSSNYTWHAVFFFFKMANPFDGVPYAGGCSVSWTPTW